VLEGPPELAGRRERAHADRDPADLGDREGGDEPLRPVGQEDRHTVAARDAEGEQRPRQVVGAGLECSVREPLVAEDHGLGVGTRRSGLVEQIAEGSARRSHLLAVGSATLLAAHSTRRL